MAVLVEPRRIAPAFTAAKIGSFIIYCTSSFSDKSEISSARLYVAINAISTNSSSEAHDRFITCLYGLVVIDNNTERLNDRVEPGVR